MTKTNTQDRKKPSKNHAAIDSALRTLDAGAGGVKAIRSTVKSANWNHQFVNRSVNTALDEMTKMEKSLSAEAK